MTEPFIGEIRAFPYDFAPQGWFLCDGSTYSASQYVALYSIIGTYYGGNAQQQKFQVPNLMGRTPIGETQYAGGGPNPLSPVTLGQASGSDSVTLDSTSYLPAHNHLAYALGQPYKTGAAYFKSRPTAGVSYIGRYIEPTSATTGNSFLAYNPSTPAYTPPAPPPATKPTTPVVMGAAMLSPTTAHITTPHENRQPLVVFRFCIAWEGMYPERP